LKERAAGFGAKRSSEIQFSFPHTLYLSARLNATALRGAEQPSNGGFLEAFQANF
jgi:hypothetical protein